MPKRAKSRKKKSKTIKLSELQRLAFCNSKHLPRAVLHNGKRKEWVGIGWVTRPKSAITGREVEVIED